MLNGKELGVVLTPKSTVDYIISRLGDIKKDEVILDPCVGPGAFIKGLLKAGVKSDQIFSFDINSEYKEKIEKLNVSFKTQDTLLSLTSDSYNQFDYIIGNPPYLNKASKYIRNNRIQLKKVYGKINAHETYAMFLVNGILRLKEGGKLGFITSDSFLTLRTHAKLRRFILDNCKIDEIILAPRNLFENQNVSTSPAIIILTKCSGKKNKDKRKNNIMRIIPRLKSEQEYQNPKTIHEIKQKQYELLPFNLFFIDVDEEVIKFFKRASNLEKYLKGFIGMHTHDNLKYIAAIEETELASIFKKKNQRIQVNRKKYKIISKKQFNSGNWKPYLKRGGDDQYYRPIMEALDWNDDSITNYDIPSNVPFEEKGIVISGISSRLAARYMPNGCYWDSNKAIGFILKDNSISIEYMLGLLNSSFYNYLAKGIINNTNSIQITGIHALPFIPPERDFKEKIEKIVKKIILKKKTDINYDYSQEQRQIDDLIFNYHAKIFNLRRRLKTKIDEKYCIY
ncbi:MAG: class I SAM-dependent DNA methyltransferase [Promethearchaeota archaeon]